MATNKMKKKIEKKPEVKVEKKTKKSRAWIPVLLGLYAIIALVIVLNDNHSQAENRLQKSNQKMATQIREMQIVIKEVQADVRAQQEDYAPKKELGEREWCKGRTCIPLSDQE